MVARKADNAMVSSPSKFTLLDHTIKNESGGLVDWIFQTDGSFSYVFLRFGLAVTFFAHSSQQALGWHGGKGLKDQLTNWQQKYHVPIALGIFGLFSEVFAAVSMTLGFLVRPAAFCLAGFIASALYLGHWNKETVGGVVSNIRWHYCS
jgi:uncharacterized membrane protein YphA (DoxX/SURF4 family)